MYNVDKIKKNYVVGVNFFSQISVIQLRLLLRWWWWWWFLLLLLLLSFLLFIIILIFIIIILILLLLLLLLFLLLLLLLLLSTLISFACNAKALQYTMSLFFFSFFLYWVFGRTDKSCLCIFPLFLLLVHVANIRLIKMIYIVCFQAISFGQRLTVRSI